MRSFKFTAALLAALFYIGLAQAQTYTQMYVPVGGPYKYNTVTLGTNGNSYNPLLPSPQLVPDTDVLALLADGWTMIAPSSLSGAPVFGANVLTGTLASTVNNLTIGANYGTYRVTPASGGSTVSGVSSSGFINGQAVLWKNTSATDSITFLHASTNSSVGNRFILTNGGSVTLPPLTNAVAVWDNNTWGFQ